MTKRAKFDMPEFKLYLQGQLLGYQSVMNSVRYVGEMLAANVDIHNTDDILSFVASHTNYSRYLRKCAWNHYVDFINSENPPKKLQKLDDRRYVQRRRHMDLREEVIMEGIAKVISECDASIHEMRSIRARHMYFITGNEEVLKLKFPRRNCYVMIPFPDGHRHFYDYLQAARDRAIDTQDYNAPVFVDARDSSTPLSADEMQYRIYAVAKITPRIESVPPTRNGSSVDLSALRPAFGEQLFRKWSDGYASWEEVRKYRQARRSSIALIGSFRPEDFEGRTE